MSRFNYLALFFAIVFGFNFSIAQDDGDYPEFACLNEAQQKRFRDMSNSVCQIRWVEDGTRYDGTGVLINNAKQDGRLLVLTAAHNLPEDRKGNPASTTVINNALRNYTFEFFHERKRCDSNEPVLSGLFYYGARVLGVYSEGFRLNRRGEDMVVQTDVAILELNRDVGNAHDSRLNKLFYAGWTAKPDGELPTNIQTTDQPFLNAGLYISHVGGHPKKVHVPKKARKDKLKWIWDSSKRRYEIQITLLSAPNERRHWVHKREDDFHYFGGFNGSLLHGASGAPAFNQDGKIYAIYMGGDEVINEKHNFSTSLNAVYDVDFPKQVRLKHIIGADIEEGDAISSLEGCYPCRPGTRGLAVGEQNQFQKRIVLDKTIPGSGSRNYVAQDRIEVRSRIREGARISLAAEEVIFGKGTDIQKGTLLEATSGVANGMSCATGCYVIKNIGDYTIENGVVYAHVANAETVEVFMPINGSTVTLGKKSVQGSKIALFSISDVDIRRSGIYEVSAKYANACDVAVEDYEIAITRDDISDGSSDYEAYASAFLSEGNYVSRKATISKHYVVDGSYNPNDLSNTAEDVTYKVNVADNIPFAKAWASTLSDCAFKRDQGFCFNSKEMEAKAAYNRISSKELKMRVYYARMKGHVAAAQAKALPLIIYAFGGAFASHASPDKSLTDPTCRWLASKGYVVAAIDYRVGIHLDKLLGPRAALRAHQDLRAAVKYWQLKPTEDVIFQAQSRRWKVDVNKIYGLGWSAGGITVLNNLYLTDAIYNQERSTNKLLFGTTDDAQIVVDPCPEPSDPATPCGVPVIAKTYDLNSYPTRPCIGGVTNPCKTLYTKAFSGRLKKGVAFAGGIAKREWMRNNRKPALVIQHENDHVVPYDRGAPFSHLGSLAKALGVANLNTISGGGAMKSYSNSVGTSNFSLLKLNDPNQAGGSDLLTSYHYPQLKFNDNWSKSKDNPRIEPKIMYYVDAFFMGSGSTGLRVNPANDEFSLDQEANNQYTIYPNPSEGTFNLDFNLKSSGKVRYEIYDISGILITSQSKWFEAGKKSWFIDEQRKLSDGIYMLRLQSPHWSATRKILVNFKP